ncbi:MAG: helix-turn-helix domain-containing protein [Gemmataceae bacterium]|nr:helix-turn-helix domain-containing protein [Gemmataceae bacterium]
MVTILAKEKREGATFGARLRILRVAAGMTLEQLGELTGMKHQNIARLEAGGRQPSWETVVRLAKALGVPTDDFLTEAE